MPEDVSFTVYSSRSCLMNESILIGYNQGISSPSLGVPLTYMTIFVLVVFGILGDVEGIPLPLKWTRSSPRRRIIIDVFFYTITGTRYFSPSDNF